MNNSRMQTILSWLLMAPLCFVLALAAGSTAHKTTKLVAITPEHLPAPSSGPHGRVTPQAPFRFGEEGAWLKTPREDLSTPSGILLEYMGLRVQ